MTQEKITLLSLHNRAEAKVIKTKLETQGIVCFVNNKKPVERKQPDNIRSIDIKVYMKDLDRALQLISSDTTEEPEK